MDCTPVANARPVQVGNFARLYLMGMATMLITGILELWSILPILSMNAAGQSAWTLKQVKVMRPSARNGRECSSANPMAVLSLAGEWIVNAQHAARKVSASIE